MARTPVSSGFLTGSRSIALIGRRVSGSSWVAWSGPFRSIGCPCESTTRPSRPSPTGKCSVRSSLRRHGCRGVPSLIGTTGEGRGTTRAPLARPCTSPVGIR